MLVIARFALFFSFALTCIVGFGGVAHAIPAPEQAKKMIEGMANSAIATLSDPSRTSPQIREQFHAILSENFDIPWISRFVLGAYWRKATKEQQDEYIKLFEGYIVSIYADRFNNYSGETVTVTDAELIGNTVVVSSQINQATPGAPPISVKWKVSDGTDGTPRVRDVEIEMVSMSLTQRSEFKTIIQNNGGEIEALLDKLRNRIN